MYECSLLKIENEEGKFEDDLYRSISMIVTIPFFKISIPHELFNDINL